MMRWRSHDALVYIIREHGPNPFIEVDFIPSNLLGLLSNFGSMKVNNFGEVLFEESFLMVVCDDSFYFITTHIVSSTSFLGFVFDHFGIQNAHIVL